MIYTCHEDSGWRESVLMGLGTGWLFCVFEEAVSVKMGKDRISEHEVNEVDYITGGDTSCLMHLDGILKRQGSKTKTIHIAEILNSLL